MRRNGTIAVVLAALVVVAAIGAASSAAAGKHERVTNLTIWVGWSARELSEFKKVVAEYDAKNPDVTVKVVGSINDDKITAALRSGSGPDVVSSFTSQNVGVYCPSGGWIDLNPYLKRDKINVNIFPATTRYYTQYGGKRCALPLLADVYGFYYNKKLFKQAGLKRPPRTLAELTAYAKKLTTRKADGSLDVVGFDPFMGFYQNSIGAYQPLVGARYFDGQGNSSLGKDPAWQTLLRWQKSLVDYYGHDALVKWQTGAGDEWSAPHAFGRGKLAMMIDGEWRVAFLAADHKGLSYGTAPMPVGKKSLYGAGYINGTIIGIPKNGKNRDEAWDLVKYLTTNTHALAKFSNGIRNVPSTAAATKSKELKPDPNFATFGKIFVNPKSSTIPVTPLGSAHLETLTSFLAKWQAGKVKDLQAGLADLDEQIDSRMKQSGGGAP
jgi:multiple sugar transport system substrate-binding protein